MTAASAESASLAFRVRAGPLRVSGGSDTASGLGLEAGLNGTAFADLAGAAADHSTFLRRLMAADPLRLATLAGEPPQVSHQEIVLKQRGIGTRYRAGQLERAAAMSQMRQNRNAHALLVALADLGLVWTVNEVVSALTAFADASVASAVDIALADAASGGTYAFPHESGAGSGLVCLALGKHGAGELNYSSDIDLVVFFDPAAAAIGPGGEPARLFNRIAQNIAQLLQERTPDGYVHRVDYRLRPDPGSTPAAVSLPAAYTYYETVGQNWERAAMIKARPVAGDLRLGDRFLADLEPFIWRKYFDFAAIADIHAMKRQIHSVRGHGEIAVAGHDIKLGRGGIREIEFFVQTQQLVFGGRRPSLRGRRTLDMLSQLEREGWISARARDELAEAYRFLRGLEHRLQMVADEQTQRLPSTPGDLQGFAAFAGYGSAAAFSDALTSRAERVQAHYSLLFEAGAELALEEGDLVFTGSQDDPATLKTLARLGFGDPARAAETVRGWHFGRRPAVTSARAREVLTELVPGLLQAFGATADPDGALARLDEAFGRMPAAVELLRVLRSHDRLRTLFADLLGTAPRLAETVAASPHVLDGVIDPDFVRPARDQASTDRECNALLGQPVDTEDFLDRLRDAARQLNFLAGARLLSGLLAPGEAGAAFAGVAQAIVRAALAWVETTFAADHGHVPGGAIAVLGLGRLGGRDLTATSDLDLVVLYDFDPASRLSSGPRPLDATVYYTRLTKRLIAALTAPTRRGRLYDVDMRLRPSGTQGPIATQLNGFVAYHRSDAELWEHMALTRCRVLAGEAAFADEVQAAITGILARPRRAHEVYRAVAAMREVVAREKGYGDSWDLKLAPGGLLDLDFLAQALVLAHAAVHPGLLGRPTVEVLAEAGRLGLIDAGQAEATLDAFRVLDEVLHWQRLTVGDRSLGISPAPAVTDRLAALAGAPDGRRLEARLDEIRAGARGAFDAVLR